MHYVFMAMAYHARGEWYYMGNKDKLYLFSKFPGANFYFGYTTLPGKSGTSSHAETSGWVYLTKFLWDTDTLHCALDTIRWIKDDVFAPAAHKQIAEGMLWSKIGSTKDIRN